MFSIGEKEWPTMSRFASFRMIVVSGVGTPPDAKYDERSIRYRRINNDSILIQVRRD
jgi:hypothetical protein